MSQFTEKPLQQPPTVVNPMAIASFGLSLVALCCAVVAAVPAVTAGGLAILLGFAALHDVGRSNGRMDGHRAAITGILLTLTAGFFYGLLHRPICRLPYIDPQTQSANHLKSIARAMYDFAAKKWESFAAGCRRARNARGFELARPTIAAFGTGLAFQQIQTRRTVGQSRQHQIAGIHAPRVFNSRV
jgi:hypothetical protein